MSEPFIGEIRAFGFNFAPRGWALCDGQLLPIAQNSALFSLLGTIYGGDGRTTFALPDLRGRVVIHQGNGPGLSDKRIGARSGSESTTIAVPNLPPHNHEVTATAKCASAAGNTNIAADNLWSKDAGVSSATYSNTAADASMSASAIEASTNNTGAGQPINNMQPYLVSNYCIALTGIFPSRN